MLYEAVPSTNGFASASSARNPAAGANAGQPINSIVPSFDVVAILPPAAGASAVLSAAWISESF